MDAKSYLMGVFDGEGCVATGKGGSGAWFVQANVTMASEAVCQLFQDTWGGSRSKRSKPTMGGLIMHTWSVNSSRGIPFLEYVVEHSLVKREQAAIALQMARNIAKYAERGYRRGIGLSRGARILTDEDHAERERLVMQIRALNGGRSRFAKVAT